MPQVNGVSAEKSRNFVVLQLLVRVPEIDSLQQKSKLLLSDLGSLLLICRPGKLVFFQAFEPLAEAVSVPVNDFQNPSVLVAKQKQIPFKWIHVKYLRDDD
jgi:hypothetical protein